MTAPGSEQRQAMRELAEREELILEALAELYHINGIEYVDFSTAYDVTRARVVALRAALRTHAGEGEGDD